MSISCVFYLRMGRLEQLQAQIKDAHDLLNGLRAAPHEEELVAEIRCMLLYFQGIVANTAGNYADAARCGAEALELAEAIADAWSHAVAVYVQTNAEFAQGRYQEARRYAKQAYAIATKAGNRWFLAYIHNDLGNIARALGNYAEARQNYQDGYALRKEFDDPDGMAVALNYLAQIAVVQGQYSEAERLFWRAAAIYQEIGDRGGLAATLNGLGRVACERREYEAAQQHLHQALQITAEMQFVPLMLATLLSAAELLVRIGQVDRGIELATLVFNHSGSEHETKERAQSSLLRYQAEFGADPMASATPNYAVAPLEVRQTISLQAALQMLQDDFRISRAKQDAHPPWAKPTSIPIDQPLIEPLSTRELEVLHLMALGHSNREIARLLVVTVGTVKSHVHNICAKLDAQSRVHAVARARELQLL
jgi:ATP/maltotriose-dependent transcriptional regulator MalT